MCVSSFVQHVNGLPWKTQTQVGDLASDGSHISSSPSPAQEQEPHELVASVAEMEVIHGPKGRAPIYQGQFSY